MSPSNHRLHYTPHRFDLDKSSGQGYRAVCSCGWRGKRLYARPSAAPPEFYEHSLKALRSSDTEANR